MRDFNYASYLADILEEGINEEGTMVTESCQDDLSAVFQAVPDELKGPVFGAFRAELALRGHDESLLNIHGQETCQ
jgi:hypothetical protein